MEIKVLGTGCAKCTQLTADVAAAIDRVGVDATLTKVESREEIQTYRVLVTPALVIDGEVRSAGRLPSIDEIVSWLQAARERP